MPRSSRRAETKLEFEARVQRVSCASHGLYADTPCLDCLLGTTMICLRSKLMPCLSLGDFSYCPSSGAGPALEVLGDKEDCVASDGMAWAGSNPGTTCVQGATRVFCVHKSSLSSMAVKTVSRTISSLPASNPKNPTHHFNGCLTSRLSRFPEDPADISALRENDLLLRRLMSNKRAISDRPM